MVGRDRLGVDIGGTFTLNRSLMTSPLSLRNYLKQRTMREVDARAGQGDCPAPDALAAVAAPVPS